jgi:hypothetical protein
MRIQQGELGPPVNPIDRHPVKIPEFANLNEVQKTFSSCIIKLMPIRLQKGFMIYFSNKKEVSSY